MYRSKLNEKLQESLAAVLPILAIVLILSFTIAPLPTSVLMAFLFGAVLLVVGMMFFSLGAELAMSPMGERVGACITKTRRVGIMLTLGFLLGFLLAAWVIGFLCEKLRPAKPITCFFTTLVGFVLYYGTGILYFYLITHLMASQTPMGIGVIFGVYCLPTMLPDLMLCVLAIMIAGRLRPVVSAALRS